MLAPQILLNPVHPDLHLGRLQIPVYSLFAAAGLMAAMALGQLTARLARLASNSLPDAILTATLSAFVISRLLLILTNFRSFLTYPLLILAVPSLTLGGIVLTIAVMVVYLRRRSLATLPLLDAAAPCATLLWAFLSVGRLVSAGSTGLPTTAPLAVADPGLGPLQPVEIYTAVAAIALTALLVRQLPRLRRPGQTLSLALLAAGLLKFLLAFLRQPTYLSDLLLLDPAQWLGLTMILAATLLHLAGTSRRPQPAARPTDTAHAF